MLKHGEVNPLNVFGLRELQHCPPHFEKVSFEMRASQKHIRDWLYENLSGRFWMGDQYYASEGNKLSLEKCVAFEEHSEASYFSLMLDQINQNDWLLS